MMLQLHPICRTRLGDWKAAANRRYLHTEPPDAIAARVFAPLPCRVHVGFVACACRTRSTGRQLGSTDFEEARQVTYARGTTPDARETVNDVDDPCALQT